MLALHQCHCWKFLKRGGSEEITMADRKAKLSANICRVIQRLFLSRYRIVLDGFCTSLHELVGRWAS